MAGHEVQVAYQVPVGGEGYVSLRVSLPVVSAVADRTFVLDVLGAVAEFTRLAAPQLEPESEPAGDWCQFDPGNPSGTAPPHDGLVWVWQESLTVWSAAIGRWDGGQWHLMPYGDPCPVSWWAELGTPAPPPGQPAETGGEP